MPCQIRAVLIKKHHSSHIGVDGCLHRAHEVMYWPGMNQEVKPDESLLWHDIISGPCHGLGLELPCSYLMTRTIS